MNTPVVNSRAVNAPAVNENPPTPPRPRIPPPPPVEHTRWSPGLIGFYLSCAGTALGATFASAGYLLFESVGWLVFGSIMALVCSVTCFLSLRAARRPQS